MTGDKTTISAEVAETVLLYLAEPPHCDCDTCSVPSESLST